MPRYDVESICEAFRQYLSGLTDLPALAEYVDGYAWALEAVNTAEAQAIGAAMLALHEVGDGDIGEDSLKEELRRALVCLEAGTNMGTRSVGTQEMTLEVAPLTVLSSSRLVVVCVGTADNSDAGIRVDQMPAFARA